MKCAHINYMVEAISGSGLDRILSRRDVLADSTEETLRARSVERADLAAQADAEAFRNASDRGALSIEALTGRPRLADLLRDPETVNRLIDETQSVDRGRRVEEAAPVRLHVFDAVRQAYDAAFFDPGRAGNLQGTRESVKTPGEE